MNKYNLRGILFKHLDGISMIPTVVELHLCGILDIFNDEEEFYFTDIKKQININEGYINVALRVLSSQGYLERKIIKDGEEIHFVVTSKGREFWQLVPNLEPFINFIPQMINVSHIHFDSNDEDFSSHLSEVTSRYKKIYETLIKETPNNSENLLFNIQGLIVGPILVALGMMNKLEFIKSSDYVVSLNEFGGNVQTVNAIFSFFEYLEWCEIIDDKVQFNDTGMFFIERCTAYGVTVSYLPTFVKLHDLFVGNPNILWSRTDHGDETHVDRTMNVWGSGGAHSHYFDTIDDIIINIFNLPIEQQPLGIADMGCGDGTLLKHLYEVVANKTERGKLFDKHPLVIVGSDFNEEARIATRKTLDKAGIGHHVLHGNISDPHKYNLDLKSRYNFELNDMLNVRSFLDHNRIYESPKENYDDRISYSTGAFAFRGEWISNAELKQNLVEHFKAWRPYIKKFGLLVLELHTISPSLTSQNLGKTVATAYDATHGYADQYIMEHQTFVNAASEAGLIPDLQYQRLFPPSELATISINLFK